MDSDVKNPVNSSISPPPPQGGGSEFANQPTRPEESMVNPTQQINQQAGSTGQSAPAQPTPAGPATVGNQPPLGTSVVTPKPRRFPKFAMIFVIMIIVAVGVWIGVGYLFFGNRKMKDDSMTSENLTPTVSPTPTFSPSQIQIENGDVVNVKPGGERATLINKSDHESTGITGFARVVVSPDEESVCFESWPPATKPALYYAKIDGSGVLQVGLDRKNCLWSTDSKSLFYVSEATSGRVDIYGYEIESGEETNLTEDTTSGARKYSIVGLSADGKKLICTYSEAGVETESGECEIDLETNELTTETSTPTPTGEVTSTPSPV